LRFVALGEKPASAGFFMQGHRREAVREQAARYSSAYAPNAETPLELSGKYRISLAALIAQKSEGPVFRVAPIG